MNDECYTMGYSDKLDELAKGLVAVQAAVPAITKDSNNPFFRNKYASLAAAVEVASPIVSKNGLAVTQHPTLDANGRDTLTTWLLHTSGQFMYSVMKLRLIKDDPQGHGSALTYCKRYAYMAILGLVAEEDDDGNAGSNNGQKSTKVAKSAPPPEPPPEPKQETLPEPPDLLNFSESIGELTDMQKEWLSPVWKKQFNFPADAVPDDKGMAVAQLIQEARGIE